MEITGKYNTAIVFNDNIDEASYSQIQQFCDLSIFEGTRIRIMPDVHAGKGCVIGYTADLGDKVVPNLIGLDIGCGILSINLGRIQPGFDKLDKFIRRSIPHGFNRNKSVRHEDYPQDFMGELETACEQLDISFSDHAKGLGSLGGGGASLSQGRPDKRLLVVFRTQPRLHTH